MWQLRDAKDRDTFVRITARLVATSIENMLAAAVAGLGLAVMSRFGCRPELERGQLVQVLAGYALAPVDVHSVLLAGRNLPAKARIFLDHLAATLMR